MLTIDAIRKTFNPASPNEVRALDGVSLSIAEGSFVVVIGTNGSGKSTLLNAVAGTFFVDTGRLVLDDADITRWPEHRRAALIGRVFQNPFSGTAPHMTIAENLALAARRGRDTSRRSRAGSPAGRKSARTSVQFLLPDSNTPARPPSKTRLDPRL